MPHEIERVIAAFCARPWAIDPAKGQEIASILMLRHASGPRREAYREEEATAAPIADRQGRIAILNLFGPMVPRASAVNDVSATFANVERFQTAFRDAATDSAVKAIVLNIDSPGGMVDLVPEAAAMVFDARRADRPIYAVANTVAASAAYWIASQADHFYASPSATVGSIGIRSMHVDQSGHDKKLGIKVTEFGSSPEKIEFSSHKPLTIEADAAFRELIDSTYRMFVADVARGRGVAADIVSAEPNKSGAHFGRGRSYDAEKALSLGMVDGIKTFDEVLDEARAGAQGRRRQSRSAELARARLSLQ